jgi:DNA-binding winged helix-turn-helix (wHTH) protein/Tol biopolymer transport system component
MKNTNTEVLDFCIGDYTVIGSRNLVLGAGQETVITPKMLAVITELAKHPQQTVNKEYLMAAVWPDVVVSDMVLSRAIADLRKVFGDSAKQQKYIETVSKKGYRISQKITWYSPDHTKLSPKKLTSRRSQNYALMVSLLLLFCILIFRITKSPDSINTFARAPELKSLTADLSIQRQVRFSPDGLHLVYDEGQLRNGKHKLVLHSLTDNKVSTLSNEEDAQTQSDISGVFSPDGKQLAFRRLTYKKCQIIIANLITRVQQPLVKCPPSVTNNLEWTADGKFLLTTQFDNNDKTEGLVLIDIANGNIKTIARPQAAGSGLLFPRISPDGNTIAVIFLRPSSKLWAVALVDVKSGKFSQLVQSQQKINQVVWDGDGTYLYYAVDAGIEAGVWEVNTHTLTTRRILNAKVLDLDFDRQQKRFVYVEEKSEIDIWKTQSISDGTTKSQKILDTTKQNTDLSLSPDNHFLAYISSGLGVDSLWLQDLGSNQNHLLLQLEHTKLSDIAFSADSSQVLVTASNSKGNQVLQINVQSNTSQGFVEEQNVSKGQWSADGSYKYWYQQINDNWQLIEQNLKSGGKQIILSEPITQYAIVNKDEVYFQRVGGSSIFKKNISRDDVSQADLDSELVLENVRAWDFVKGQLYYIPWQSDNQQNIVYQYSLDTNSSTKLFALGSKVILYNNRFYITGDAKTVYFADQDNFHTDVVLMQQH